MKTGGFDCVIGNPPWGAYLSEEELEHLRIKNNKIIVRMIDTFMYFIYQVSQKLNNGGTFGMIVPDVILYQIDNAKLREYLLRYFKISFLINMGDVFEKVTRPASIIMFEKADAINNKIYILNLLQLDKVKKPKTLEEGYYETIPQKDILNLPEYLFVTENPERYAIFSKFRNNTFKLLKELADEHGIQRGVSPDYKEAFVLDSKSAIKLRLEKGKLRKVLTGGKHVKRYFIDYPDLFLIYTSNSDDFNKLPNIRAYIDSFSDKITCKEVKQKKHSIYALHRTREENIFLKEIKLVGVITGDKINIAIDDRKTFVTDGIYLFGLKKGINEKYIVGILNSSLITYLYRLLSMRERACSCSSKTQSNVQFTYTYH